MSEWMPITSAPKDGTAILVVTIGRQIDIAVFDQPRLDFIDYFYKARCKPTHWMPLPEPPK